MGVHGNGRVSKGRVEDDVGCFSAHARQCLKVGSIFRNLAIVLVHQDFTGLDDVLGFAVKQANGLDVILQAFLAQFKNGLRGVGHREQFGRGLVNALVSGLGRQGHRHQELKRAAVVKLSGRTGIVFFQPLKNLLAFLGVHGI